jgi:group I intron endonuclease
MNYAINSKETTKTAGVYSIQNVCDGKIYVGSTVDFNTRFDRHRTALRNNQHFNQYLQRAWKKHREVAFLFKPVIYCDPKWRIFWEQICIDACKSSLGRKRLYNASLVAGSPHGIKRSPQTIARMREAGRRRTGWKHTAETRALMSARHMGKPGTRNGCKHTPEARAKIGASKIGNKNCLGYKPSPGSIEKFRQSRLGKPRLPETIAKMRIASMGNQYARGCVRSAETRELLRQAALRRQRIKKDNLELFDQ